MAVLVAAAALLAHALVNIMHLPGWSQLVSALVVLLLWVVVVDRFFMKPLTKKPRGNPRGFRVQNSDWR